MAQHDYVIANQSGASFRADLNNALAAIVSNNSGASAPSTTYAYQWWADTTDAKLKLRNAANDGWIDIQELDGTMLMQDGTAASPGLAFASDLDTGFFRAGANQLGIATNGTERVEFGTTEVVFNDGGSDIDFRVEGNTNANLFFVDAGNERVGLGTSSPGALLDLAGGSIRLNGTNGIHKANADGYNYFAGGTASTAGGVIFAFGHAHATNPNEIHFRNSSDTTRAVIDSSGNVGIGNTAPASVLSIKGTSGFTYLDSGDSARLSILQETSPSAQNRIFSSNYFLNLEATGPANGAILFTTGTSSGTEKARIDSSGRLLCGTSSSASAGQSQYALIQNKGNTLGSSSYGVLSVARGTAAASLSSGSTLGIITFSENSGGEYAQIKAETDGTGAASDYPGRLVFSTTADGASTPTARMAILQGGTTCFGKTSSDLSVAGVEVRTGTAGQVTIGKSFSGTVNGIFFHHNSTYVGGLNYTNSGTSLVTSSDYRLKENVVAVPNAIARVNQLNPIQFNFIAEPDETVEGFIAHELGEVVSEACFGEKDAVDENGNIKPQSIAQEKLIPLLTAALKEALAKIETLEGKVSALENA